MMSELGAHAAGNTSRRVQEDGAEGSSRRRHGMQARRCTGTKIAAADWGIRQSYNTRATSPLAAGTARRTAHCR